MRRYVFVFATVLLLTGCGASAPAPSSAAPSSAPASAKPAASSVSAAAAIPRIPAGRTVNITAAYGVPSAVFTPVWIALDKGYFKDHQLNVKLQAIEGVTQAQAVIAGDVQIGNVGGAEVLDSRVGGAGIVAIAQATDSPVFEIHAPPSIKRVEDLKGKTIAITRAGSSTDMATRVMLVKHGLNPDKDAKLVDVANMPGILAALQGGKVQAGTMSPPTTIKANTAGFPKVASAVDEHVPLQQNLIVTMKAYADQHPEVVFAYLEAEMEGLRDFFNKPDTAVAAIAKYTKSDDKTAKAAYDAIRGAMDPAGLIDENGLKTVQQYGKNTKTRGLTLADAHDDTFVKALQASGFVKGLGIKK